MDKITPFINDKEKQILELLVSGPLRQKDIRNKLKIPKASFSRYIVNLKKKNLIYLKGFKKNKTVYLK